MFLTFDIYLLFLQYIQTRLHVGCHNLDYAYNALWSGKDAMLWYENTRKPHILHSLAS